LINDKSPKTASGQSSGGGQNQAEPIDLQTFGQIADQITVSGAQKILGKVNINTAPREVLAALFGGDDQAEQLAHTVMANRSSLMYGFQSIAELLDQQSMTLEKFSHCRAGHRSLGCSRSSALRWPRPAGRGRRRNVVDR
jgi:hypothetical protein